jgi:hypothetical protein
MVWQALDRLPPRRRAVLVLYELEGTPIPEIARLIGVTPVTVRLASDARAPRDGECARRRTMSHWKDRLLEADRALTSELSAEASAAAAPDRRRRSGVGGAFAAPVVAAVPADSRVADRGVGGPGAVRGHGAAGRHGTSAGGLTVAGELAPETPPVGSGRQQLQFATPGGTRIIWVFDAEFEVKGTLP